MDYKDFESKIVNNTEGIDGRVLLFILQLVQLAGLKKNEVPLFKMQDASIDVNITIAELKLESSTENPILLTDELFKSYIEYRKYLAGKNHKVTGDAPLFPGYSSYDPEKKPEEGLTGAEKINKINKKFAAKIKQFDRDLKAILKGGATKLFNELHKEGVKNHFLTLRDRWHDEKRAIRETADFFRIKERAVRLELKISKPQSPKTRRDITPEIIHLAIMDDLCTLDRTSTEKIEVLRKKFKKTIGTTTNKDFSTIEKICAVIKKAPLLTVEQKSALIKKICEEIPPRMKRQKNPGVSLDNLSIKDLIKRLSDPAHKRKSNFNDEQLALLDKINAELIEEKNKTAAIKPPTKKSVSTGTRESDEEHLERKMRDADDVPIIDDTSLYILPSPPPPLERRRRTIPLVHHVGDASYKNKSYNEILATIQAIRDNTSLRNKDFFIKEFNRILDYINFSEYWGNPQEKILVEEARSLLGHKRYKIFTVYLDEDALRLYNIKNKSEKSSTGTVPKKKNLWEVKRRWRVR